MSFKFIAGLAIGAVVVHFLNTTEGKALIGRFKKDVNEVEDNLTQLADNLVEKGKSLLGKTEEITEEPLIVVIESNPVV